MSIWTWLLRRPPAAQPAAPAATPKSPGSKEPIPLPSEPSVFECRECHKVFEARRRRPTCPECDSPDVELMSA
jgi:Zn finger protein HypA/HybF involved in hydrogenase expression